jgi:type I restriction enzyme, S subunit
MENLQKTNGLPAEWRWVPLGELLREAQAGFACGERDPEGVIQLRMNNVDTRGNFVWKDFLRVPASEATIDHYRLLPGDVLFNNTNSTELVGKSALFEDHNEPVVFSNHFTRLRTHTDQLIPAFLASWLNHLWREGTFAKICNRWIGQSAVKADKLLKLDFPLPPLKDQQRVAAILQEKMATVEKARAAAGVRLKTARTLAGAFLRTVFSSAEAKEWPMRPLGNIAEVVGGIQKTPDRLPQCHHRPFLTVRNVQRGWLDLSKVERFEISTDELQRLRLKQNDILIVEGNGSVDQIGRNAIFEEDAEEWIHQNHIIRVRLFPEICLPRFASFYLNSDQGTSQMMRKAQTTSGLYTLSAGKVESLAVPCPPVALQANVERFLAIQLEAVEDMISTFQQELQTIESLPGAILHRVFEGEN